MANRSYLYTCDEVPGAEGFYARGLSEYNWEVPLVHMVMMGGAPRVVRSAIWGHEIGILADRAGAFERALAFFSRLGEGVLPAREEFEGELAAMRRFLAATPPSRYLLLEAGEIFDVIDGELAENAALLAAEVPAVAARAERAIAGREDRWLASLRETWREEARPGWWSEVLYFSFPAPG